MCRPVPRSPEFDRAAAEFTQSLRRASNWKSVYVGTTYRERVEAAIEEARSACDQMAYHLLTKELS